MNIPDGLRYSKEHEWVRVEDNVATVGITDFAQDSLGDIVFVEPPEIGATVTAGASVAEIESTKSVSDIYAPCSGTVRAVNERLATEPELANRDPYGEGWIMAIELAASSELGGLLDADAYRALTEG
ncbi:MAG: glycine cleavage system protein GcvH [Actinomycetota bacterium]